MVNIPKYKIAVNKMKHLQKKKKKHYELWFPSLHKKIF